MTTCPMCGQRIPVEGCSEHIAMCGLDDETRATIMATAPHYHWGQNIPGYLPMADEPNVTADWDTARSCLLEDLERAGDWGDTQHYAPGWGDSWTEACEEIRTATDGEEIYVNVSGSSTYDLGVSYWLTICAEDECQDALEELGEELGAISPEPGKPCMACATVGRLTWLNEDGSCRRADVHR